MRVFALRSICTAVAVGAASLAMVACTTTSNPNAGTARSDQSSIDAQVDATLSKLYGTAPGAREMVEHAPGVLVFPSVVGASFGVGAEYGRGALRMGGRSVAYYSATAGSLGFQAGAQSKAVIYVFNTAQALNKFRASDGWTAGADATVAVARIGANGMIDTQTLQEPVVAFVMTNVGLEAGVSVQGSKITRVQP